MTENLPRATHVGKLNLGDYEISCAVLPDKTRVIVERTMATALGKKGGGAYWQRKKKEIHEQTGAYLPEYVSAGYLQPYVSDELKQKLSNPIRYIGA